MNNNHRRKNSKKEFRINIIFFYCFLLGFEYGYTVMRLCIQLKLDSVGTVVKNSISSSNLGTLVSRWTDS